MARHVGTHGAILKKVGDECEVHLREFAQALREAVRRNVTPLNVAAYCIGGEKWSVGLVTVLYHCVKGMGAGVIVEPVFPFHTCSEAWPRPCRGDCNMCTSALHSRMSGEIQALPTRCSASTRYTSSYSSPDACVELCVWRVSD